MRWRLSAERLEGRDVPAVTIRIDYTFDTTGFFNDPTRRAVLEQVGNEIGSHLTTHLAAIAPGGGDTWSESFFNPATGGQATIDNPTGRPVVRIAGTTTTIVTTTPTISSTTALPARINPFGRRRFSCSSTGNPSSSTGPASATTFSR